MRALMKVNNPRLTRQAFERTQTMEEINGQSGAQKVRRTRSWQPPSKKGSKKYIASTVEIRLKSEIMKSHFALSLSSARANSHNLNFFEKILL